VNLIRHLKRRQKINTERSPHQEMKRSRKMKWSFKRVELLIRNCDTTRKRTTNYNDRYFYLWVRWQLSSLFFLPCKRSSLKKKKYYFDDATLRLNALHFTAAEIQWRRKNNKIISWKIKRETHHQAKRKISKKRNSPFLSWWITKKEEKEDVWKLFVYENNT